MDFQLLKSLDLKELIPLVPRVRIWSLPHSGHQWPGCVQGSSTREDRDIMVVPCWLGVLPIPCAPLSSTPLKGNPRRGTQGGGTLEGVLRSGRAPVHTWTG